jgi:RHS repeat-associated protein
MVMPGRNYNNGTTKDYRFGFNGKENDNEVKGEGNQQDYGMRIYDPRLGRFLSEDPLISEYPFYSPYHFAGNCPTSHVDLDGLEPTSFMSTNKEVRKRVSWTSRLMVLHKAYRMTGGDKAFFKHSETETKGAYVPVDMNKFLANNKKDRYNRFVNTNTQFLLKNESSFSSEQDLVNTLLGDFFWGNGPENIVFPHNGKYSKALAGSIMVGETLVKWAKAGNKDGKFSWGMGLRGEITVDVNSGFTSLEHFIGSATLKVSTQSDKTIKVEIFNVTSLTSGDYMKDVPIIKWLYGAPLKSTVRNGNVGTSQVEYSNQSQYFSFTLTQAEAIKIISQFTPGGVAPPSSSTPPVQNSTPAEGKKKPMGASGTW